MVQNTTKTPLLNYILSTKTGPTILSATKFYTHKLLKNETELLKINKIVRSVQCIVFQIFL